MDDDADQDAPRAADLTVINGVAREDRPTPCPVCGRRIVAGDALATSLGDARRQALGITLHAACLVVVGREGMLELMVKAYRDRGK